MFKGVRFRIYPNKEQERKINSTLGCCRFVYNKFLSLRDAAYEKGEFLGYAKTATMLTQLKKKDEYKFLKKASAVALRQALWDLDKAYRNFFSKRAKHPQFKKKRGRQSYRISNTVKRMIADKNHIKVPKLGLVRFKQTLEVGHIRTGTIIKTATGKYYIALDYEFEPERAPVTEKRIGIDVGIKVFYTDSNGNTVNNPKYLEKKEMFLKRAQRRFARKKVGSNNRKKQRLRVARVYEKICEQRRDFLQKQSTMLVRENQTICVEDLLIKGLLKNHHLARAISSVSWAKFFQMLEYKAKWYGRNLITIPQNYTSSQICHNCGYKHNKVAKLHVRRWECPNCHIINDRDVNASINILNKGLA